LQDIQAQVAGLTFKGFMGSVPWTWLKHYPRYFKAIAYRIEKGRSDPARRDADATQQVRLLWTQWLAAKGLQQAAPESLADFEFRWMIEELRVSLFAQPLGTSVKISPQRCEKMLKEG
jgi:ATP-dependent helicase HrpA